MAYRELTMIEITEVLRRVAGGGRRQTAQRLGLDRKTVRRYLRAVERCGLRAGTDRAALTEAEVTAVVMALRPRGASRYTARAIG
jgi:hypothetical protein